MTKTELKTIPITQILANFTQPREKFDKEKTKELAESILGNGLINPITIRKYKDDKYMIVSGERRWQAHKIAGLNNIQAFVKKYDSEGQMMVESLIENVHRVDLSDIERAKYLTKIKEITNLNNIQLAKKIGFTRQYIEHHLKLVKNKELIKLVEKKKLHGSIALSLAQMKDKKDAIAIASKSDLSYKEAEKMRQIIPKAPEEVKKSLLSDEITTKQAEDIGRIHSPKAREQALKQVKQHKEIAKRHEHIADITPKLMERAKPEISEVLKKKFQTSQRFIFENLHEAQMGIMKSDKNLKKANIMLSQLMSKSFEYGLDKKTLATTIQQMRGISDRISQFDIVTERFDELKDNFIERVEDRLEELK